LVRFCGDYRIKPHIPLLEEFPANCFKFQSCDFTAPVYLIKIVNSIKYLFTASLLGINRLGYLAFIHYINLYFKQTPYLMVNADNFGFYPYLSTLNILNYK